MYDGRTLSKTLPMGFASFALATWFMYQADSMERLLLYGSLYFLASLVAGMFLGWDPIVGLVLAGIGIALGFIVNLLPSVIPDADGLSKHIFLIAVIAGVTAGIRLRYSDENGSSAGIPTVLLGFAVVILVVGGIIFGIGFFTRALLWIEEGLFNKVQFPLAILILLGLLLGVPIGVAALTDRSRSRKSGPRPGDGYEGQAPQGEHVDSEISVVAQDGFLYDGYGKQKGRISEDGYLRDQYGNIQGRITEDGYHYDAQGNLKGRIKEDGTIVDADGNYLGRVNEHGSITDKHGNLKGRIQK